MNTETSPFKRLREATGFSKVYVYKNAHLSESALTFIEEGMYLHNPPAADQELLRLCSLRGIPFHEILTAEYGAGTIPAATIAWQKAAREALTSPVQAGFAQARQEPDEDYSPIEDFARRVAGNKTAFCKRLKIQVAAFYQFNIGRTTTMPRLLREALVDAGLNDRQIDEIVEEQAHWLAMRKHRPQVALVD